jgi:CDP-glucose 4,6-dehydratase
LTIQTNLNGTLNIIESIRLQNTIKSAVLITSDKCYQNNEIKKGYKENDRLGGDDPYSASKAAAEIIFNAYIKSNLLDLNRYGVATARAGNVIGGGDWSKNRIIPDCIKSIINKKKFIIRNPNSTRPWQHVLEPLSGYLLLAKKLFENPKKYSSSYNFGPTNLHTLAVKDVVKLFFGELKKKKKIYKNSRSFKESKLLKLNSLKSKKILSWKNTWNMKESIKETASWYKNFIENRKNLYLFTNNQIRRYFYD